MHKIILEFLGLEVCETKEKKTYYNAHFISGYDSCKFYLTDEMKKQLDSIKPKKFQQIECIFDIVPVTYQNNGFSQTVYALKLKGISDKTILGKEQKANE